MIKRFVDTIIDEINSKKIDVTNKSLVLFPSRRAAYVFKNRFISQLEKSSLLPDCFSLTDFYNHHSEIRLLSSMELLLLLHSCQLELGKQEDFSSFYDWGTMLLNDFNDIDKSMVEQERMFTNINEWKEAGDFLNDTEELKGLKKFWDDLTIANDSKIQNDFKNNYQFIPKLYHAFRKKLIGQHAAYEGMLQKEVIQKLQSQPETLIWEKVFVCGFNKLEKTDQELFSLLKQHCDASFLFDSDPYWLDKHQAGTHLNKNIFFKRNIKEEHSFKLDKAIHLHQSPLKTGECRIAASLIEELIAEQGPTCLEETLLLMPDESQLIPLLKSIPKSLDALNITVGYPLDQSLTFELLSLLYNWFNRSQIEYTTSALKSDLLSHPILRNIDDENESLQNLLNQKPETSNEINEQCIVVLEHIKNVDHKESDQLLFSKTEKIVLHELIQELKELLIIFGEYPELNQGELLLRMSLQHLKNKRIAFTGEPLKGLQITGLLESRCLDFKNVIVLSSNEGILPKKHSHNSYIPYTIRKFFGLPLPDDFVASEAYYFYRLLKHAERVHLIYNAEPVAMGSNEISRFITQLFYETKTQFPHLTFKHFVYDCENKKQSVNRIAIKKSAAIRNELDLIAQKGFSPSSIHRYIFCPMQFYFSNVLKLKEPEVNQLEIDSRSLGTVIHGALEDLYKGNEGKVLNESVLLGLKQKVETSIDTHAMNELGKHYDLNGRNQIMKSIIKTFIEEVIENDVQLLPITINAIEKEFACDFTLSTGRVVQLKCRVDRVNFANGKYIILDYKTGKDSLSKIKNNELDFLNENNKARNQLLISSYIFSENKNIPIADIDIALHKLRKFKEGTVVLNLSEVDEIKSLVKDELNSVLTELLDDSVDFEQTNDLDRCKKCAYSSVCNRTNSDDA